MPFYDAANPFHPDRSIGYLVRRSHQLGQAALQQVFTKDGPTHTQWSAMMTLLYMQGATAAELARELAHDKGAMTRLVDALHQRGWITRARTGCDRRMIELMLTPEGETVTRHCLSRVTECWNGWLADWPREEIETLLLLLRKLRDTLDRAQATCS